MFRQAIEIFEKNKKVLKELAHFTFAADARFFYYLCLAQVFHGEDKAGKKKYLKAMKKHHRFMKKVMEAAQSAFAPKYYLMSAELKRIAGGVP